MTAVRRQPVRRQGRAHYRRYALSRGLTFMPGAMLPLAAWGYLSEPYHWAGLGVMLAAGLFIIPVLVIWVLFCLPALVMGGFVPRSWRVSHRERHGRENCKSSYITSGLRRTVEAADRNRCLYCGITRWEAAAAGMQMHVDHWMPWIAGGRTTFVNCSLLCGQHNEIKSCYWRERSGRVWYHRGSRTPQRLAMAAQISRTIRWRRWNPLRLWRAAWALG
jgi:hypothetical protein